MERNSTHGLEKCIGGSPKIGSTLRTWQSPHSNFSEIHLLSTCKPEKVSSLFSSLDWKKAELVRSIGFGGLLRLPRLDLNLNLCLWLLQRLDINNMCLRLDGAQNIPIRNEDVSLVFGIPFEGRAVRFDLVNSELSVREFTEKLFGANTSPSLSMSFIEHIISKDYGPYMTPEEIDAFHIATVFYATTYLLAPEPQQNFPVELIGNFVPEVKPAGINWASLVLWTLHRASMDANVHIKCGSNRILLYGCCLFLQVFYIDNLNFGPPAPNHCVLPRAADYFPEFMSDLILSDCNIAPCGKLLQFGKTELRPACQVGYTRAWIDDPGQRTQNDYPCGIVIISEGDDFIEKCTLHSSHAHADASSSNTLTVTLSELCNLSHITNGQSYESAYGQPLFERKIVTSHSNFRANFCEDMFEHPAVSSDNKYRCYLWMTDANMTWDELHRDWISFACPRPLKISGSVVRDCLRLNGPFTVTFVDAIMVLWSLLDAKICKYFHNLDESHNVWRHFLPASFAVMVDEDADFLNSKLIQESFIGNHINYNVEDCQRIIMPVLGSDDTWSCYFWDFKYKTISVLDPVLQKRPAAEAREKHHDNVLRLHSALFACKDHFFSGWDVEPDGWTHVYLTKLSHQCSPQNSGLYASHYARTFCGPKELVWKLTRLEESSLSYARGELLYHFITCPSNGGYKSDLLMEKIRYLDIS